MSNAIGTDIRNIAKSLIVLLFFSIYIPLLRLLSITRNTRIAYARMHRGQAAHTHTRVELWRVQNGETPVTATHHA